MDFGRITDPRVLERTDWTLPPLDSEEERAQLARIARAAAHSDAPPRVYVGMPVWSENTWNGSLYPPGTKSTRFLEEYARQFSTVEINATFYAVPPVETAEKWAVSVDDAFRFCPKVPQSVSRSLGASTLDERDLHPFIDRVRRLGARLGPSFVQLPPDAGTSCAGRLRALLGRVPRELRLAVEFRHPAFFRERRLKPEVVDFLASHRAATVITDTAGHRELSHASVSSTHVLIRFAASNGHPSDERRLDAWATRIGVWLEAGMKEIYFTVHATDPLAQIELARAFIVRMNAELARIGGPPMISCPEFHHDKQAALF